MPRLLQDDHTTILDTFHRYARLLAIDTAQDTGTIRLLDGDGNETGDPISGVPLYFHCEPSSQIRVNGALEGAAKAFREEDQVVVRIEEGIPLVLGVRGLLRPCYAPHGVFFQGASVTLREMEGKAHLGTLNFKDPIAWGSAQDVWFLGSMYWVVDGGAVKYNAAAGWYQPRDAGGEVACDGLPGDVTYMGVRVAGNYAYMTLTREGDDNYLWVYRSLNGVDWTAVTVYDVGVRPTGLDGYSKRAVGTGWIRWGTDRFCLTHHAKTDEGAGYPQDFLRMYRIGLKTKYTSLGELNTTVEAWTMYADVNSDIQFYFTQEAAFTVEGGFVDLQLNQIY
jgi:hypothetical protein